MRKSKRDFYHSEFLKFSGNCKQTWNTISEILNNKKIKHSSFPSHFNQEVFTEKSINGVKTKQSVTLKITDKQTIADQFNVFFQQLAQIYQMISNITVQKRCLIS